MINDLVHQGFGTKTTYSNYSLDSYLIIVNQDRKFQPSENVFQQVLSKFSPMKVTTTTDGPRTS